jgi:hypothetical protein
MKPAIGDMILYQEIEFFAQLYVDDEGEPVELEDASMVVAATADDEKWICVPFHVLGVEKAQ